MQKPIVEIKWVDAEHYSSHWVDEWKGDVDGVTTIGYLMEESETTLILAMSIQDDDTPGGIFKIPKVTIKSRKEYGDKGEEAK